MKKIALTAASALLMTNCYAVPINKDAQEKENMKILAKYGLPLPGSGIKIVPRVTMNLTEEELYRGELEEKEIQSKGYKYSYNNYAQELLRLPEYIKSKKLFENINKNPESTGLKPNVNNLQLAFEYKSLNIRSSFSANSQYQVFASTPKGGFHKDKGGWSGVAEFFTMDNSVCNYSVMNVKASNTAAELAEESIKYLVNNKPTLIFAEGSSNSGFIYRIKWFDNDNFHELECADMHYSDAKKDSVIELAKLIDNV